MKRRNFLSAIATLPLFAFAKKAAAFDITTVKSIIPGGLWNTLQHATDGTDPSTSVSDALPKITQAIAALDGKPVDIEGYIQPLNIGFGKKEYLLSRQPFHCAFCYGGGRASLVLVQTTNHIPPSDKLIKLSGTMRLQKTDPADYYFQLDDAKLVA